MGHETDLLTYPLGRDVHFPGLRIYRICGIPGLRRIRIGPSLSKIPLDFLLFLLTCTASCGAGTMRFIPTRGRILGLFLARLFGIPHIYDMHFEPAPADGQFPFFGKPRPDPVFSGPGILDSEIFPRGDHHLSGSGGACPGCGEEGIRF